MDESFDSDDAATCGGSIILSMMMIAYEIWYEWSRITLKSSKSLNEDDGHGDDDDGGDGDDDDDNIDEKWKEGDG